MPRSKNTENFIIKDYSKIVNFTSEFSDSMSDYVLNSKDSNFIMFYKDLTHSDLGTFGKLTNSKKELGKYDDNLLYYMTSEQMQDIATRTGAIAQTAHQSCIGLKNELYTLTGLPNPRDVDPYLINDFYKVYLVNETIPYFQPKYTKTIFEKLNKKMPNWDFDSLETKVSDNQFTEISIHVCVHGLGEASKDIEFHALRHNMFKGDSFALLFEIGKDRKNMFVLLEKNPIFFSIIGETNKTYTQHQIKAKKRLISEMKDIPIPDEIVDEVVSRQQQGAWRKALAKEMMGYTTNDDEVFCPLTYLTVNFSELGALFKASHIKGFSDKNTKPEEKYDINNGLLLSANADSLFDKHLITIDENKNIVFSFLLDDKPRLIQELRLYCDTFKPIFNDKRMEYLKYHRELFEELENKRKSEENFEDIE